MKAWVLIRRDPIYLDTPVIKSFLFSRKNKKNIVNLSSAKLAQRVVNIDVFIFSSISQKKMVEKDTSIKIFNVTLLFKN